MCCTKQHIAEIHLFCAAASVDRATSSFHADLRVLPATVASSLKKIVCQSVCVSTSKKVRTSCRLGSWGLAVVLTISIVRSLVVHAVHANGTTELMCDITIDDEVN